uniref:Uncharacterized protein n=1 Tax=Lactuca sativa TaxID=4236 RepID=A0A9R1V986_LACSA|nr:hypothetical protein LSAT_V11C600303880 [Lactuca sativa]
MWPKSDCPFTLTPPKHHTQVVMSTRLDMLGGQKRREGESLVQSVITRGTIPEHVKGREALVKLNQRGRHREKGRHRQRGRHKERERVI